MRIALENHISLTEKNTSTRTAGIILALCLGFSLSLHVISVVIVAYIWTAPVGDDRVSYLEMRDLVPASQALSPVMPPVPVLNQESLPQPPAETVPVPENQPVPEAAVAERTVIEDIRKTPLGLGMTYGFVSSLGNGATLREDVREYYLVLVERINKIWWERAAELSNAIVQDGVVVVAVQYDGTLLGRGISRGTGSPEVDQALLESIDKAAPLPPLPASYGQKVFSAPLKITAPSRLLGATTHP